MMQKVIFFAVFILYSIVGLSQEERADIRKGNEFYETKEYNQAEVNYLKALEKKPESLEGSFNLGNVTYRQEKYQDAADRFEMLAKQSNTPEQVANSYYNMGNSLLQNKEYEKSIEAYKNALRNNPKDTDAKYNLSYAQAKLKQQQQQEDQDQNKEDENKEDEKKEDEKKEEEKKEDENKKNKDQEEKKEEQDKQEQEKKEGEKGDEEKEQQSKPEQISKEDAQRLLDALKNDEQKIQKDLKKKKAKVNKVKIEKDW